MNDAEPGRLPSLIQRALREIGLAFRSLGEAMTYLSPEASQARHAAEERRTANGDAGSRRDAADRETTVDRLPERRIDWPVEGPSAPLSVAERRAWEGLVRLLSRPQHDPRNGRG